MVDLRPEDGNAPNHVALDEIVFQLDTERYVLLEAVDLETREFGSVRLHPACTIALTERSLREHRHQ